MPSSGWSSRWYLPRPSSVSKLFIIFPFILLFNLVNISAYECCEITRLILKYIHVLNICIIYERKWIIYMFSDDHLNIWISRISMQVNLLHKDKRNKKRKYSPWYFYREKLQTCIALNVLSKDIMMLTWYMGNKVSWIKKLTLDILTIQ